ncbi:ABC transporter permease [Halobacteriales archaeon QS_8_65_32]|nr:MAG: ABC transporter permease [Halobacteriales archaeon QS_8_65_32]
MTALGRIRAETVAAGLSFSRRRTAVFFTFFFPVILIAIFGVLVGTRPTGGGLFTEPPEYYLPGYLAVVVLFTPLSRVGSTIARHREGGRFEKLATTPLSCVEWLAAHALVNVLVIGAASLLIFVLVVLVTGATVPMGPATVVVVPFVVCAVALFCGVGAILGRVADSQDGVVAASNALALPLLFLSETFVPPDLLPAWFRPVLSLSPLTYFARGVRAVTSTPSANAAGGAAMGWELDLVVLVAVAIVAFVAGAYAIPRTG